MIKVTLEFETVDAAIVSLSKIVDDPVAPAAKPRKGRADAGKVRGPYKGPTILEKTAAAGLTIPPPPDVPAVAPKPVAPDAGPALAATSPAASAAPAATVLTAADAQQWVAKLFEAKGLSTALDVLSRHGAKAVRELRPEQYGQFVADVKRVLEGGVV